MYLLIKCINLVCIAKFHDLFIILYLHLFICLLKG